LAEEDLRVIFCTPVNSGKAAEATNEEEEEEEEEEE
jgi:hypothetical protein